MTQKSECLNGGYSVPPMNNCICPPGFIGNLCETGNLTTIVFIINYIFINALRYYQYQLDFRIK